MRSPRIAAPHEAGLMGVRTTNMTNIGSIRVGALLTILLVSSAILAGGSPQVLFVIDMQTNLLSPGKGGLHVDPFLAEPVITNVNSAVHAANSLGIPVLYIRNVWTNPLVNFFTHDVCKKGAIGTEFDKRVDIVDSLFFEKSAGNSFSNAQLSDYIERHEVKTIYVTGIMAEGCVGATAVEGLRRGLEVRLVVPAVGSSSRSKLDESLRKLKHEGAIAVQQVK